LEKSEDTLFCRLEPKAHGGKEKRYRAISMEIKTFYDAENYLMSFIPPTNKWGEPSMAYKRTKHFMKLLGDPQNKLIVIHIAGTSGKGSTAYMTSALLHSQGLRVGMGISPHIHHIRERIQINNSPLSKDLFCKYLEEMVPVIEEMKKSEYGAVTYFEIIVALSYYTFLKEKMDVVVMEVGLGGEFDATNTVTTEHKISVITRIGFDHMEFLGTSLESIAMAKAKIIQNKNLVIKLNQEPEVMNVIETVASEKKAQILKVNPAEIISAVKVSLAGLIFTFKYKDVSFENLRVSMIGDYQIENASTALVTFVEFMKRITKPINDKSIRYALQTISIPGRMQIIEHKGKELVIDGAHNGQKMEAFIKSLIRIYPGEKFTFLLSFKKGKDYEYILKYIIPYASDIIVTSFENTNQGMGQLLSEKPEVIAKILEEMSYKTYTVVPHLSKALNLAVKSKHKIIITGSLYLIGEIYNLLEN
jgi:dihydrofolate synthase/folylpolyglutamate synthase